jgi:hypothetical protein
MSDDPIRDQLAALPLHHTTKPYGTLAILQSTIEATGNADALVAWIEANGGHRLDRVPVRRRGVGVGPSGPPTTSVEPFYVIKRDLLRSTV